MFKENKMPSARGQNGLKVHGGGGGTFYNKNKNFGFSLVELIVVIAILVVFAAILIPSLLQYTENSRAQKDVSAMDEVVNAFQLAMADQDCYDEMLQYSCTNNYITYTDSSGVYGQIIADGEFWAPDGSGRATTITFNPSYEGDKVVYRMDEAIVNDMTYGNGSVAQSRVMEGALIDNNQCYFKNASINGGTTGYTYNRVRQSIGDVLEPSSQTYRNSSFTVFILFTQKDGTTVADVNGSFNGTNVYEGAVASKGSGTFEYNDNGDAITTITTPGTTTAVYSATDLSGGGNFSVTIDYKQKDIVSKLEDKYTFQYYSSLYLAVNDVNNNQVGSSADCNKENAVAGVIVNSSGYPTIIILNNSVETNIIETSVDMSINLNGYCIESESAVILQNSNGTLIINGDKAGSQMKKELKSDQSISCLVQSLSGTTTIVCGGQYTVSGNANNASAFLTHGNLDVKNIKIDINTNTNEATDKVSGINGYQSSDTKKIKVINSDINIVNSGPNQYIANVSTKGDLFVSNSTFDNKNDRDSDGKWINLICSCGTMEIYDSKCYNAENAIQWHKASNPQSDGMLIVDGGEYKSECEVFCIATGASGNAYIQNLRGTLTLLEFNKQNAMIYCYYTQNLNIEINNCDFELQADDDTWFYANYGGTNSSVSMSNINYNRDAFIIGASDAEHVTNIGVGLSTNQIIGPNGQIINYTNEIYGRK